MRHVRPADIYEVLSAGLHFDAQTRAAITNRQPFSLWRFESIEDVAGIGTQLPAELVGPDAGRVGAVHNLYEGWIWWLHSAHRKAIEHLRLHAELRAALQEGRVFPTRAIILGPAMQLHDGRHRMFALYEHLRGGAPMPQVEVFWNRGPDGSTELLR